MLCKSFDLSLNHYIHIYQRYFNSSKVSSLINNLTLNNNKQPICINLHSEKYASSPNKKVVFMSSQTSPSKYNKYEIEQKHKKNISQSLKSILNNILLPRDYPNSVKEGYLHYTKYSFLVGTILNMMDFLSTQILINSLGKTQLSPNKSMKLSAGLNWVIKDGIGEFSSIFFGTKYNRSFEQNIKQWRVLTLFIYNLALFGEIICMNIKSPIKLLACASIAKCLKMCAALGNISARIGILDNLCKEKNISDLQNKSSSQANISFALGTIMGMCISFLIPFTPSNILKIITMLSGFYLYYSYKSITKISIPALNSSRAVILLDEYLKNGKFKTMKEINKLEQPYFTNIKNFYFTSHNLDYAINKTNKNNGVDYTANLINLFKESKQNFICLVNVKKNSFEMYTNLQYDAKTPDFVIAFLYSLKTYHELNALQNNGTLNKENVISVMKKNLIHEFIIKKDECIGELIKKDFDLKTNLLENKFERYQFNCENNLNNKRKLL